MNGCGDSYVVVEEGTQLIAVAQIGTTRYQTFDDAIAAAKTGDVIRLLQMVAVEGEKTWNLSGITVDIANVEDQYGLIIRGKVTIHDGVFQTNGIYGIGIADAGELIISGGTFRYVDDCDYLIGSYGSLMINGGQFVGQYNCVNCFAGSATINGGTFKTAGTDFTGEYESETVLGEVSISGGAFDNLVTDYLCDGYCMKLVDGMYVVGKHTAGGMMIENVVDATCTANGSYDEAFYCVHCSAEMSRVTIETERTSHSYDAVVTAPSCTADGYTTYTCSACGDTYQDDETDALEHSYDAVVTPPSCTSGGYTTYTCANCGYSYVGNRMDASGHSYVSVVTAPTCEQEGYTTDTCSVCGYSRTVNKVNALGHNMVKDAAKAPTCTETGLTEGEHCTRCEDATVAQEEIAALGHSYDAVVTEPTCTMEGYITYTCAICNDSYTANHVDAIGHNYEAVVTVPTCTTEGFTTYTCAIH